ncbi:MAG: glycosyltransferase [Pseudonocardia sediminis]
MLTDVLVPHNRWDLLAPYPVPRPRVTVVVCHYDQPGALARMWPALRAQTLSPVEVVVADDGSPTPPVVPAALVPDGCPVRVVRQADLGFRAAAARNAGARDALGEVLVFLDADVVPEPGFVENLTRRVALCPDVLAVGRRRHAELAGLPPGADPSTAPRLPEPAWLRDGYTGSRDLLDADGRSFRFVISAVMACRTSLFTDLDGFDERFVGYGGEDWDLAYRAWNAGAVLVHEPDAVAWHDGPDWAGRESDHRGRDLEAMRVAALVPEPHTRGAALPGAVPDVLVDLDVPGAGTDPVVTARTVHSVLRQSHRDLVVRVGTGCDAVDELYAGVVRHDPWTPDQLRRARARVTVHHPIAPDVVARMLDTLVTRDLATVRAVTGDGAVAAVATSTRAAGRSRRWAGWPPGSVGRAAFGHTDLTVDAADDAGDLAGWFARRR